MKIETTIQLLSKNEKDNHSLLPSITINMSLSIGLFDLLALTYLNQGHKQVKSILSQKQSLFIN